MDDDNIQIMNKEIFKIKQHFLKSLMDYRQYIEHAQLDAPLEVLCLPKNTLSILHREGFTRVSEISSYDLTKIKGLGLVKIAYINSRLQQFLPC